LELLNILVIDDSSDFLEVFSYILQTDGYVVKTLLSSKNMQLEIENCKPDVILVDLMLHEESGIEVAKHLKTDSKTMNIPVILMSVDHKSLDSIPSMADETLQKPFNMSELLNKITSAINVCKSKTNAPPPPL
jgi:DNA-binding response OmpR family regulator